MLIIIINHTYIITQIYKKVKIFFVVSQKKQLTVSPLIVFHNIKLFIF
ncbi:hypothetical protein HMPREF3181_00863 [Parvimonas sp. KA00067]|nr:hypothetical protein HMPREF3181_00863 [Parvimonas sp. KA00067]